MNSQSPQPGVHGPSSEAIVWRAAMEDKVLALRDLITTRLDAMDRAATVFAENLNRVPTLLDRETARLTALFEEKTNNIRASISGRDDQARQDKVTAASTVDLALASLKELIASQNASNALAIAKAESATANDLVSLNAIIGTTKDGLNSEINNLKQRLDRGEGMSRGQKELRQEDHMATGSIAAMITGIVGVLALVLALFTYAMPHIATQVIPTAQINPTVGADTKRVDDLVAQRGDRERDFTARMDALSARLNALTSSSAPSR